MIAERLKKDARFLNLLPMAPGGHLIDSIELDKIINTMLDAACRIEALEKELEAREGKPMTEQEIHYANY